MSIIQAYVTNLGKYNEGEMVGKWINLPIEEKEFKKVLNEIGIDGEKYEEYFFTDYSYSNVEDLNLNKHEKIDDLNKIAEKLENLSDYELDAFNAIVQHFGVDDALEFDIYNYNFCPNVTNDEELGHYYVDEIYFEDIRAGSVIYDYIDYESLGWNVSRYADGGFTDYGFIEKV